MELCELHNPSSRWARDGSEANQRRRWESSGRAGARVPEAIGAPVQCMGRIQKAPDADRSSGSSRGGMRLDLELQLQLGPLIDGGVEQGGTEVWGFRKPLERIRIPADPGSRAYAGLHRMELAVLVLCEFRPESLRVYIWILTWLKLAVRLACTDRLSRMHETATCWNVATVIFLQMMDLCTGRPRAVIVHC
ncbi:hypothetical protein BT67DRAFT_63703 [Trichocladium antarcticum]|uniref:Uncharacterized protein n=1 Tax=Trichocladium antarcticum TaxID=1450529 RepID=A0AAN6ZBF4_9PEZI|nr:hypothetical protein BT67DRAFT_63703 [Trichocladium antarcticum]